MQNIIATYNILIFYFHIITILLQCINASRVYIAIRDGSESRLGSDSTRTRRFLAGSDSEFIGESKLGSTRTRSWDSGVLGESMVTPEVTKQILSWPTLSHINLLHELKSTYFNFFEVAKIQQWSYSEDKMSQQPARPKISNWILSLTTYEQVNFYLIKPIWDSWLGSTRHRTRNLLGSQDSARLGLDFSRLGSARTQFFLTRPIPNCNNMGII